MADVKPLKLVDQGAGVGRLVEFEAGDTLPKASLPALSAADVGAVAAGDPRLSDAREWIADTVSQDEAEAGTGTTRRAWTAQRVRQAIVAWWNGISSAWGRGFVASADAAAGRTALELGNAATRTALGSTGALYSRDSILGTVSQSGGVPTGAIIERGSNANGEYVRFADGTQICWLRILTVSQVADIDLVFNWAFPASFINVSSTVVRAQIVVPVATNTYTINKISGGVQSTSNGAITVNCSATQDYLYSLEAIGRWY